MPSSSERPSLTAARVCQWVNLRQALHHFATYTGPTQSQQHIKPLHWYVACRLVLEGGFHPDNITPRPPFAVVTRRGESALQFAPNMATGSERTILGGLKTKDVLWLMLAARLSLPFSWSPRLAQRVLERLRAAGRGLLPVTPRQACPAAPAILRPTCLAAATRTT